ncbi:MAG: hypothetical protein IKM99_03040 [Bacteroidales bacterium]|nr:hypothetical protein [Bacteroidales bacterium]
MTSFRKIFTAIISFLLLVGSACQSKKADSIPQLLRQLEKDSIALEKIQQHYPARMQTNFRWCDSMLQFIPEEQIGECFDVLNLAQAYLRQFDETVPVMKHTLSYTKQQLTNLQNDIDTKFISDSLAAIYLNDEIAVADTLHNRILYFQDRLSQQDKELTSLMGTISKATSK